MAILGTFSIWPVQFKVRSISLIFAGNVLHGNNRKTKITTTTTTTTIMSAIYRIHDKLKHYYYGMAWVCWMLKNINIAPSPSSSYPSFLRSNLIRVGWMAKSFLVPRASLHSEFFRSHFEFSRNWLNFSVVWTPEAYSSRGMRMLGTWRGWVSCIVYRRQYERKRHMPNIYCMSDCAHII